MDFVVNFVREDTFWNTLLLTHFLLAVGLLAAVTIQAVAVLIPSGQIAGNVPGRVSYRFPVSPASYTIPIVILYVIQALFGAWVYVKYRTYVRIPLEQTRHWWTVGSFEFKEHIVSMGLGLLPAYWYFWQQPESAQYDNVRRWITVFLAISVWYAFIVGHVATDFRGVGS
jgi:heme A synthase